jgi:hypothetical protein
MSLKVFRTLWGIAEFASNDKNGWKMALSKIKS